MKLKKILLILTVIVITLGLVFLATACSKTAPKPPSSTQPTTTTTTTTKPTTTTTTTTTTTASVVTLIPHSLEGRGDCLICHQTGIAGAKAVPADHAGRANSTCTACHKVK